MNPNASRITLVDVAPSHFAAIVAIERMSRRGSVVALTEGSALDEALRRGHHLTVALWGADVAGWIWFHVESGRDGEQVGQLFRLAVAEAHRQEGVGRALIEHARENLTLRGCTKLRATVDGADIQAQAFFERMGFGVDAVVMERSL